MVSYHHHSSTFFEKVKMSVAQSCLTLCDPMDCSPSGSPVPGILQARILEWVAILQRIFQTWASYIAGRFFTGGSPGMLSTFISGCLTFHCMTVMKFK